MRTLGFESKKEEIKKMIGETDMEGTEKMNSNDFFTVMTQKMSRKIPKKKSWKLSSSSMMKKLGHYHSTISHALKELGKNLTDEELQEMTEEADRDGDGEVNEQESLRIMKKTRLY